MPKYILNYLQNNTPQTCNNFRKFYDSINLLGYIVDTQKGILDLDDTKLEKVYELMKEYSLNLILSEIKE